MISTIKLEKLYESYEIRIRKAERLPGAQLPAGPPKLDFTHGADVFSNMLVHSADLSLSRDFSKTHRRTQRMYSWIAFDLTEVGKLLRSETNSQTWVAR